jgi:GT2 family glycosyltransferase
MKSVSVVIPTYNGKGLLKKNLPSVIRAVEAYDAPTEIIIVDDAGTDGTAEFIQENYPQITLLVNSKNSGFGETINRGIFAARNEIVLALNNDIVVEEDLYSKTLRWFDDADVFSVTPNIVNPSKGTSEAITRLKPGVCWFGTVNLQLHDLQDTTSEIPLFFGSGGASFYSRKKLLQLGGFDPVYHPFYVEDLDLSYRAWKSGWKCLFEPSATVYHETSSTILSLHKKRKIKFIGDRNRTLFLWLNITDIQMIIRYFCFLPFSLIYDIVAFRKYKFVGFFWALGHLSSVVTGRRKRKSIFRMTDKDVMRIISYKKQTA